MRYIRNKPLSMVFGLLLYSVGIVCTIHAALGLAPWDVLHQGLSDLTGLSFGTMSISVGLIVCVVAVALGEKLGLGTWLNMLLIGIFVDLLQWADCLPYPASLPGQLFILLLGLFLIGVGCYFYMSVGWGSGPRDSLMVVLSRRTGGAPGLWRIAVEGVALLCGWLLGGPVGLGTVVSVLCGGLMIQLAFFLLRFDAASVRHETLTETLRSYRSKQKV